MTVLLCTMCTAEYDCTMYRVTQKEASYGFWPQICSRSPILLFHMCFGIRISSPFHLATLILPIANHKCPKNAKNPCADVLIGLFSSKDITIASLLQVTIICVYNTVRPPQQRQGTPPVQEVNWEFIDLKLSSPEKWSISCKPGHLLIKAQLQLERFWRF